MGSVFCLFLPVLPEGKVVAFATTEDEDEDGDGNCSATCNEDKKRGSKKMRCE